MIELLEANWVLAVAALVIGLLVAWYVFHASRKTRVTGARRDVLDEGAAPAERNRALMDAAPASGSGPASPPAVAPVTTPAGLAGAGTIVAAAEDAQAERRTGEQDDLARIKGVGPKLVARLRELGVTSFAEIAAWSDADIDRIDPQLGRFEGRIRRDDWVGQAQLLAAGDDAAFADRYGRTGQPGNHLA